LLAKEGTEGIRGTQFIWSYFNEVVVVVFEEFKELELTGFVLLTLLRRLMGESTCQSHT